MSTVGMLRELEAKATPGPWFWDTRISLRPFTACVDSGYADLPHKEADGALIAAMRNAMPALLRVADAAKARFEVWTPETYQELKEALEALEEADNG